ncbi:ParB N-terminal domain-containing protein [Dyadobacter sp. CY312]|uniref:ParB N-terminal domain-containing protein n=1 Tax=Dyadobacter sp. CY312 TaxID=2907303 RepID=UPI001F1F37F3|nr:ParB N-terminal domain-containing protein [Dyadobacter sp. CY312]MCE7041726.1 ParB N-terminal domain-containing protein [Dyadobacter sp. CY312]
MKQKIEQIATKDLSFDYQNPRIAEFGITTKTTEQEIIQILWNVMGVEEIVLSIRASGFFEHEPLLAVKEDGRLIIIEGNRRLAAVKCILNREIADYIGINKNQLSVSPEIKDSLEYLPVILVEERKDAWKFIGFKHINGPAKWGSYAKAQYISQIKNEYDIPLEEIASQIGDTHKTVQKLYQGLQVIEQAEQLGKFNRTDISANRLYFSHLYTGLTYEGFKDYLGIKDISEDTKNPVPEDKWDHLEELLTWLFGSRKKEVDAVILSQNPDLRRLDAVIRNKEATYALRDGVPLIQAYELSQPKNETFEQSLLEAKRALQKAQSFQTEGFDGKDVAMLKLAATVAKMADELYDTMEKKWKSLQDNGSTKKRLFSEE